MCCELAIEPPEDQNFSSHIRQAEIDRWINGENLSLAKKLCLNVWFLAVWPLIQVILTDRN